MSGPHSQTEPAMPAYLRWILAAVAVGASAVFVVTTADYLQPVFPALLWAIPAAVVIGLVCFYERARRPGLKTYFDNGLAFAGIVGIGSIGMIAAQHAIEGGTAKGAVAAFQALYDPPQTLVPQPVDMTEIARHAIAQANFTADDAGFIKARAQGNAVWTQYKQLGIEGDAASLRSTLLAYPTSSNEYRNLGFFMASAHSDHYARPVRQEIVDLLKDAEKKETTARVRDLACGPESSDFVAQFVRINLGGSCEEESRWVASVIDFAKNALTPIGEPESAAWWSVWARHRIKYTPTTVPAAAANGRSVTYPELLDMYRAGSAPADTYMKVDGTISVFRPRSNHISLDIFDPSSGLPMIMVPYEGPDISEQPCWVTLPEGFDLDAQMAARKPKCRARVTLFRDQNEPLKVVGIENVVEDSTKIGKPTPSGAVWRRISYEQDGFSAEFSGHVQLKLTTPARPSSLIVRSAQYMENTFGHLYQVGLLEGASEGALNFENVANRYLLPYSCAKKVSDEVLEGVGDRAREIRGAQCIDGRRSVAGRVILVGKRLYMVGYILAEQAPVSDAEHFLNSFALLDQ